METALQTTMQLIALSWNKRLPPTPGDIVEFENSHWLIQPALA